MTLDDRNQRFLAPFSDITASLVFLTRIPLTVQGLEARRPLSQYAWAFPLIGALVGGIGAAIHALAHAAGVGAFLSATLAIAIMIVVTGALHEDGLVDTADGFGGGANRDAKLRIMRDSRIGTYGAVALALSLIARILAISSIGGPASVAVALVVSGALSRAAMLSLMSAISPARDDGLSATGGRPNTEIVVASASISIAIALVVLPFGTALAAIFAAIIGSAALGLLSIRQIGGQTGDVLGAAQQASEIAILIVLVALTGAPSP